MQAYIFFKLRHFFIALAIFFLRIYQQRKIHFLVVDFIGFPKSIFNKILHNKSLKKDENFLTKTQTFKNNLFFFLIELSYVLVFILFLLNQLFSIKRNTKRERFKYRLLKKNKMTILIYGIIEGKMLESFYFYIDFIASIKFEIIFVVFVRHFNKMK